MWEWDVLEGNFPQYSPPKNTEPNLDMIEPISVFGCIGETNQTSKCEI